MQLNINPEWLLAMAEKEDGCIISVGGLVSRILQAEAEQTESQLPQSEKPE